MCERQLIGSFYFRQTPSRNLIGEFSNNLLDIVSTESCDSIATDGNFVGRYSSTWNQNNAAHRLTLEIEQMPNLKFKLEWKDGEDVTYSGEGFIVDDLLTGFYIQGTIP